MGEGDLVLKLLDNWFYTLHVISPKTWGIIEIPLEIKKGDYHLR